MDRVRAAEGGVVPSEWSKGSSGGCATSRYSLMPMTSDGIGTGQSPLRHYLRSHLNAIAASFEAAAGAPGGSPKRRALERTIAFDVGASVIARPGTDPIADVYAPSGCPSETMEWVRRRALALYEIVRGGAREEVQRASAEEPRSPVRSCLYSPLATGGAVVGVTYLASLRERAFTADDERVLASLVTHASGAYRRLEASLHQLRLSPRQSQVLALIASGLSDKEVASRLGLAHRTVRTHVDRMLREHGLRSRTEAVAAWLRGQQG